MKTINCIVFFLITNVLAQDVKSIMNECVKSLEYNKMDTICLKIWDRAKHKNGHDLKIIDSIVAQSSYPLLNVLGPYYNPSIVTLYSNFSHIITNKNPSINKIVTNNSLTSAGEVGFNGYQNYVNRFDKKSVIFLGKSSYFDKVLCSQSYSKKFLDSLKIADHRNQMKLLGDFFTIFHYPTDNCSYMATRIFQFYQDPIHLSQINSAERASISYYTQMIIKGNKIGKVTGIIGSDVGTLPALCFNHTYDSLFDENHFYKYPLDLDHDNRFRMFDVYSDHMEINCNFWRNKKHLDSLRLARRKQN